MNLTGNKTQEAKISVMGDMAHHMFPNHESKVFTVCFRNGLARTLDSMHLQEWAPVMDLPKRKRELFFQELVDNSANCLSSIGLTQGQVVALKHKLILENKKFLNR